MAEAAPDAVISAGDHLPGITRVCFSPDGKTIFTGGYDCLVRIHEVDRPDTEPGFHDNHDEPITSLSCSANNLFTGSVDNIARVFSYPQNEYTGFLTRSSGVPIRWVSADPAGERVAVCADDLIVKIIHAGDTDRVTTLADTAKPVRSASWDPTGKYLVTASCDGKLRIYDTSGTTPALLKIMEGVIAPSESDSLVSCYAVWHPSGAYFAIPTRINEVGIINREGWTKGHTYASDGPKTAFGELAWSPNGRYLIGSSGPRIHVWSTESRALVSKYTSPNGDISGLEFSPRDNMIAATTTEGHYIKWTSPIPSSLPDPVITEAAHAKNLDKLLDDDFGDGDEDMEDRGDDLDDLHDLGGDDWIVDDDGAYGVEDGEKTRGGRTEVVNVTRAQDAFAPGSTIMKNKKRYLAFNMIGTVDVTDQETHYVVNVEFHDKAARRGYHFQDHTKYSMASLGEQGIVYAAPTQDGQPSTVYYRPYDSWASQAEWTVNLLPGEDAQCVAAGGPSGDSMGSVIVATSKGFLRFLSSSGIQRYMWRLGEDTVSMAASKDAVFVVHREGGTSLDGCQNLRYTVIDLESYELIQEGRIPLPRRTTLSWVGFTAEGSPAMYDSTGLLSVLDRFRRPGQARWVPVLDSNMLARKQGRTENYWPVGVSSTHFTCIILKGSETEPWFPRPLVQELEMQMPLLNMDNQQGKLEESVIRGELQINVLTDRIAHTDDSGEAEHDLRTREVALDKELLQLVQGACKADNLQRALDITRIMHNPATVEAAGKVAAFYHLPGLQERIQDVKAEVEDRRYREKRARRAGDSAIGYTNGSSSISTGRAKPAGFSDFAPKAGRRNFGGVPPGTGAGASMRDTTPMASGRSVETYIPETPGVYGRVDETPAPEDDEEGYASPETKRKRMPETPVDDFVAPKKRADEFAVPAATNGASKNPFAKKPQASNPFAKPAVAKPLDAIKSTSFFERVDDMESSGVPKAAKKAKKERAPPPGPKQTTLFGMKKPQPPARPVHQESTASTETDGDVDDYMHGGGEEETQTDDVPHGVLEDSLVQETMSPEPLDDE